MLKKIIYCLLLAYLLDIVIQIIPPNGRIGISFSSGQNCNSLIRSIRNDSTANKTGLKVNDCIVDVDKKDVTNLDYMKVSHLITGKPKTNVVISVKRNDKKYTYTIMRERTKIDWLNIVKKW